MKSSSIQESFNIFVPAGHVLDGHRMRIYPESGATTYWTEVLITSKERLEVEKQFSELRNALAELRFDEAAGPHIQMSWRKIP